MRESARSTGLQRYMEASTTELFSLVCPACDTLALEAGAASGHCPACGAAYDPSAPAVAASPVPVVVETPVAA